MKFVQINNSKRNLSQYNPVEYEKNKIEVPENIPEGQYIDFGSYYTIGNPEEFTNSVQVKATYNFFIDKFEQSIKDIPEVILPNLYWFFSTKKSLRTIFGTLDDIETKKEVTSEQTFKELVKFYKNPKENNNDFVSFFVSNKTFYIDPEVILTANGLQNSFPAFVSITFKNNQENTRFAKELHSQKLLETLCKICIKRQILKLNYLTKDEDLNVEYFESDDYNIDVKEQSEKVQFTSKTAFFPESAVELFETIRLEEKNGDFHIITNEKIHDNIVLSLENVFELWKTIEKSFSNFKQNKEYSNVIMFEIKKYRIDSLGDKNYISTFFVPNFSETFTFHDTQVKEGETYFYEIDSHIFDQKIYMKLSNKQVDDFGKSFFDVTVTKLNIVHSAPWFNSEGEKTYQYFTIKSPPSLSPEVDIQPLGRDENFVRISVKNRYGSEVLTPVVIKEEDKLFFSKIVLSNGKFTPNSIIDTNTIQNLEDDLVYFRTDELGGVIEVYRTEQPPGSFRDFENKEQGQVGFSNSKTMIDAIEPNVDYYYCFRIKDFHGGISNPTDVIKIRMNYREGSTPYFTKSIYYFKEKPKVTEKKFRKFLFIRPTDFQSELKKEGKMFSKTKKPFVDGDAFGKKYLFEITSEKTGKKVNFLVDVKVPEDKQE